MQFQPKEGIVGINSVAQADAGSDIRRGGKEVEGFEVPNETRKFKIDYYITTTDRPQGFRVKVREGKSTWVGWEECDWKCIRAGKEQIIRKKSVCIYTSIYI